jgi:hypothetical protein
MILLRSWTDRRAGGEKEIVEKGSCVELEFGLVGGARKGSREGLTGWGFRGRERGLEEETSHVSRDPFLSCCMWARVLFSTSVGCTCVGIDWREYQGFLPWLKNETSLP